MSELRQRKKPPAEETTTVAGPEPPTVKLHTISFETFGAEYGVTVSDWDDGTLIEDCEPNDLIYRSGLRKGDVIKTINGKLASPHLVALQLLDDFKGSKVTIEYEDAASIEAQLEVYRKARRARINYGCKLFGRLIMLLFVAACIGAVVGYYTLPQDKFKDYVDMMVFPLAGFARPKLGIDGNPKRRVLLPKDPTKPWSVPGWNRKRELDAWQRLKKTYLWGMRAEHEAQKEGLCDPVSKVCRPEETPFIIDIMEQIRATNGSTLEYLEEMTNALEMEREMFTGMGMPEGGGSTLKNRK